MGAFAARASLHTASMLLRALPIEPDSKTLRRAGIAFFTRNALPHRPFCMPLPVSFARTLPGGRRGVANRNRTPHRPRNASP